MTVIAVTAPTVLSQAAACPRLVIARSSRDRGRLRDADDVVDDRAGASQAVEHRSELGLVGDVAADERAGLLPHRHETLKALEGVVGQPALDADDVAIHVWSLPPR